MPTHTAPLGTPMQVATAHAENGGTFSVLERSLAMEAAQRQDGDRMEREEREKAIAELSAKMDLVVAEVRASKDASLASRTSSRTTAFLTAITSGTAGGIFVASHYDAIARILGGLFR